MGVSPCNVRAREQTGFFVTRIIQDGAFLPHRHERKFFTMKRKLAATVTLACLKTAVGLITSCAETFSALFPDGPKYRIWAIIFSLVSLLFANLGLSAIISYSLPVLMFLYPLSIALIALALLGKFFGHDRTVYCWTIGFTLIAAVYDLIIALPESVFNAIHGPAIKAFGQQFLPFADLGLGWICPTLIGTAIGLILHFMRGNRAKA